MLKLFKSFFVITIMFFLVSCDNSSEQSGMLSEPTQIPADSKVLVEKGNNYVFGGDIILSKYDENHKKFIEALIAQEKESNNNTKNNISTKGVYYTTWWQCAPWPQGIVKYYFDKDVSFSQAFKDNVRKAMNEIESKVPGVRFEEKKHTYKTDLGLRIVYSTDSKAAGSCTVGYSWQKREDDVFYLGGKLSLKETSTNGTILHELLHGLGMLHEHQRPDRHKYVEIKKNNIIPKYYKANFAISPKTKAHGEYDYNSIMHYSNDAFKKSDLPWHVYTIVTKDPVYQNKIGQDERLSDGDINTLNHMYKGEAGKLTYYVNQDHFCWRTAERTRKRFVHHWVNRDHFCHRVAKKKKTRWRDEWKDVDHLCWRVGKREKKRLVDYWINHDHWCGSSGSWKWTKAGACGGHGWPHQYRGNARWETYYVDEEGWFWTKAGQCGGKGWPHQVKGYWETYYVDEPGWHWTKAGECTGTGWPHQYSDLLQGYWEDYTVTETGWHWTKAGECTGTGWPHQRLKFKPAAFE